MKYYKIENEEFKGFFSREVHGDIVDSEDFFEIPEEKWRDLLESNGEVRYINGELVSYVNTREDDITLGRITLETEKSKARAQREKEFNALDILDAKVAVGRDTLIVEEKTEIDTWYAAWKELPNNYTDIKVPTEESYPERPSKIDYYYKGE